ncbi:MAG TPA: SMC family ATPase [Methanosarcinales archaeon]|nr:SMC family ATPase [Methanosarcinales archaeon]
MENIKSYKRSKIPFKLGVNGISGENGHGKTTILEAIGYVLFDYIPYKTKDFIRKGAREATIKLRVIANDELEYVIYRKISTRNSEYSIYTPLGIITGKTDVQDWIIENLFPDLKNSKELPLLFENAIGVPQGTFTTAFLLQPAQRSLVFDKLLKLDEYKTAFTNLLPVMKMIEKNIESIDKRLLQLKTRTEKYDQLKKECSELDHTLNKVEGEIKNNKSKLLELKLKKEELTKKKENIDTLKTEIEKKQILLASLKQQCNKIIMELNRAKNAQNIVKETEKSKYEYLQAKKQLKELNNLRSIRDNLKDKLVNINFEIKNLKEFCKQKNTLNKEIKEIEDEIEKLEPRIELQNNIEKELQEKTTNIAIIEAELKNLKNKMKIAGETNICPIFDIQCNTVSDFSTYFKEKIQNKSYDINILKIEVEDLNKKLMELSDPKKQKNKYLAIKENKIKDLKKLEGLPKKIENKKKMKFELESSFKKYANLEKDIDALTTKIETLEPFYKKYIQNQPLASKVESIELEYKTLLDNIQKNDTILQAKSKELETISKDFKEEELQSVSVQYENIGKKVSGLEQAYKLQKIQLKKIISQINEIEKIFDKIKELEKDMDLEKQFYNYAKFIRNTLKDSAQKIVSEFINNISTEANNIYCEIMNDFSQELKWKEDYDIVITERGNEKSFRQLSGGEQMSAALAVRLALLKMLSNSDIVFLDEPTQNMDENRREHLAEQIQKIRGFNQVFVISHDDTFQEKCEHVIRIKKVNGESRIVSNEHHEVGYTMCRNFS